MRRYLGWVLLALLAGCRTPPAPEPARLDRSADEQQALDAALVRAVELREPGAVGTLLSQGADANARHPKGWPVVVMSSFIGDVAIVNKLVEAGADPSSRSPDGVSAVAFAAHNGHLPVVLALIAAGVDPDQPDGNGWVPLAAAAEMGHLALVRALIDVGVDIDAGAREGRSALMRAARFGYLDVVEALLEAGADPDATSDEGRTAAGYALGRGHRSIASRLYEASADAQRGKPHQQVYAAATASLSYRTAPFPAELPEGKTLLFGEYSCAQGRAGSLVLLSREGGDLALVNLHGPPLSERNPQPVGYFVTVGTYNPESGQFTVVPDHWIVLQAPGWIMGGRHGRYDPGTGGIVETKSPLHWANADGSPVCQSFGHRPLEASPTVAPLWDVEVPPVPTLRGKPSSLPRGRSRWSGRFRCRDQEFTIELLLDHGEGGDLTGEFHYRLDAAGAAMGFLVIGTHNPATGRLSLGPDGWVSGTPPTRNRGMFFLDGHFLAPPQGLVVRVIRGDGPCDDGALVTLVEQK